MRYLFIVLLLGMSSNAWSCSCIRTASIEEAIAGQPILVEAQVVSFGQDGATLRVRKVLKGAVAEDTILVGDSMCYESLDLRLMELQHTYILPLSAPTNGLYELVGCAQSGLELADGRLYKFGDTSGPRWRLRFYKRYSDFQRELLGGSRR